MKTGASPPAVAPDEDDLYPTHDGEPMESSLHLRVMFLLYAALQEFFADREDVFVAANLFWFWQEGNPTARRSPDTMVVPGVGNHDRESFMSWKEGGAVPAVVFELTSKKTWRDDTTAKYDLYQSLGVAEYFLFDPTGRCIRPRLQGHRLRGKKYQRLRPTADGSLGSTLGFRVRGEGKWLRLIDATTGEVIPTPAEAERRWQAEKASLAAEIGALAANAARERAEKAALAAEVERLRQQDRDLSGGEP